MAEKKRIDLQRHLPSWPFVALASLLVGAILGAIIFTGFYDIGADAPHTPPVHWLIETLRDRSIDARAAGIMVPADLNDPKRISAGAGLYADMCAGCHLAPGMERTEISQGLYPPAPELSRGLAHTPAQEFWMIKHGVKLTAMPAWGKTHSDGLIWDMVAFIRKLPSLSPAQYHALVISAPADHDMMMRDMSGMNMGHELVPAHELKHR